MVVTLQNYKDLKNQVEGRPLNKLELAETYPALCYLTHRALDEQNAGKIESARWTRVQVNIVRERQRALLASKGIYVLRG